MAIKSNYSGRFPPPGDLLPVEHPVGVGTVPASSAFPDLFDYDDLSLGPEFDLATAQGPIATVAARWVIP